MTSRNFLPVPSSRASGEHECIAECLDPPHQNKVTSILVLKVSVHGNTISAYKFIRTFLPHMCESSTPFPTFHHRGSSLPAENEKRPVREQETPCCFRCCAVSARSMPLKAYFETPLYLRQRLHEVCFTFNNIFSDGFMSPTNLIPWSSLGR